MLKRSIPALLAASAGLLLGAAPALANGGYVETGTLGAGPGAGAGQLDLAAPSRAEHGTQSGPSFEIGGSGVAVDAETHDVYVADTNNHRISEFEAKGTFVRAFGKEVDGLEDTCTLICTAGKSGSAPGELAAPRFIAVDNACALEEQKTHKTLSIAECAALDPSNGDVYVGDGVGTRAVNELQWLEFTGASEGAYTLTLDYNGKDETTKPIAYAKNAYDGNSRDGPNAEAAQQALEGLANIGPGNARVVEVGEGNGQARGLDIEFVGALEETAVPRLTSAGAVGEPKLEREGSKFAGEVISKFTAEGQLISSWGDSTPTPNGQLTGKDAEKGPFGGKLEGITVDPSGNLFVMDEGDVYEFTEAGASAKATLELPIGETGEGSASGLAVNGQGDLYVIGLDGHVEEYSPTGEPLRALSSNHSPDPTGFALDEATGQAFVGLGESLEVGDSECASHSACEVSSSLQLRGGAGVAVDPGSGAVYAASTVPDQVDVFNLLLTAETKAAGEVMATSMTVNGEVNPEGSEVASCYFEYGPTTNYGQTAPCEPGAAGIGDGTAPVPVSAKLTGLQGGTVYHFRVVAVKREKAIPGDDVTAPVTRVLPVITEPAAGEVTASSATLSASVDPEDVPVESCTFEYGTSASYGLTAPCRPDVQHIGAGPEPVPVKAALEGLQPNTTYHWRLSVKDANGEVHSPDHVFVYPTAGSGALPDGRTYEMVSPVQKDGAAFVTFSGIPAAIAADGSHVMLSSIQCYGGSRSCTASRSFDGEPVSFSRTAAGWVPTFIAPPASTFSANSYYLLAPEEESALFSMPTPPGGQDDWYLRSPEGSFTDIGPIFPSAGGKVEFPEHAELAVAAGFSHVVWEQSIEADRKEWWTALGAPEAQAPQVYEYAGAGNAQPLLVGVNDEGRPLGCPVSLGDGKSDHDGTAVSADGRTVYITACGGTELDARIDGGETQAHTVTLNTSACAEGEPGAAECAAVSGERRVANFQGASTDGTKAFFLDTQKLTDEATQGTGDASSTSESCEPGADCNLYLSECTARCAGSGGEELGEQRALIDVSAGDLSGFGPNVLGVVGTSTDDSHVYFLANGVLAPGAAPGSCISGKSEAAEAALRCNLYVYERDARYPNGHVAFIASVPGTDAVKLGNEATSGVNVTPDGRFLVFASHGALTPDDTRTGGGQQIFRYDADPTPEEEAAHVPQLIRVSVGADGYNDDGNAGVGNAAIASPNPLVVPYRGDPSMSNDGSRVFFQSPIALTPHALNDVQVGTTNGREPVPVYAGNVYEWEAEGVGSCPAGESGGCTYLISDGRDVSDAVNPCELAESSSVCVLGTDATGDNVFFTTADQLVPEDTDTAVDVYDAQVCSEAEPCAPHASAPAEPCQNEQCHGIPEPTPSLLAPGTASFNGEGNVTTAPPAPAVKPKALTRAQKLANALKACAKDKKKSKRKSCEATARKKYGVAKKSSKKKGK